MKPALGTPIRGKKTITCEKKQLERACFFYKTPHVYLGLFERVSQILMVGPHVSHQKTDQHLSKLDPPPNAINLSFGEDFKHPFMVIMGMVKMALGPHDQHLL